ncbi:Ig-like domain-containing protein, partial [Pseudomonas koreensis]|uniref:Ig-like domain-containing protein n=1 Tax=Pseudomonas koreensis TaxID=198620 RepID=UPI0037F646F3
ITGPIAQNGVTDDNTPTFNGSGNVGDTVIIRNGKDEIGRVVITEADGSWTYTPETKLDDGNYAFNVVMKDPAGNESNPSADWNVEIDTTPPQDPVLGNEGHGLHEIIDDAGDITGPILENGVTDDNTPTFNGSGNVGDTVIIRNGIDEIGRVVITEADGSWTYTPETKLDDGNYAFNVVMKDPAGNESNPSADWNVKIDTTPVVGPTQTVSLMHMGKDSGYSDSDFRTNDGSAGRLLYGELSQPLKDGQYLNVSCDGGMTWFKAVTDGNKWIFQDNIKHVSLAWTILLRVADDDGNFGPVTSQEVILDKAAPDNASSGALLNGYAEIVLPDITLPFSRLEVGDRLSILGNRGEFRYEHTLTQEDFNDGVVRVALDPSVTSFSFTTVDKAGNTSGFKNIGTPVIPLLKYTITGEESEIYGTGSNDSYQVYDIDALNKVTVIDAGEGSRDEIKLMGSDQVLDISALKVKLNSISHFDITGTGDNTLKLSLGDVLQLSSTGAWISNEFYQVGVTGNAGDKVELSSLLPNGMEGGEWVKQSSATVSGKELDVYFNESMNAQVLVTHGLQVDFI